MWCENHPRQIDALNTNGAVTVASAAEIVQPRFIYLSNSYVFDGRKGNYKETDIVFPPTVLGKSKLGGENLLKNGSASGIVLRCSPLYGRGNSTHRSYLDELRFRLDRGERIEANSYEYHSFAPIYDLCELMKKLVQSNIKNKIFHYGGLSKITFYEFAVEFAKHFGYDHGLISQIESPHTKSIDDNANYDYSLNSTELIRALKFQPLLLEEGFNLMDKLLIPEATFSP